MLTVNRAPVRVLIVERCDEIGPLYRDLFTLFGCTAEVAQNGANAVAKAETFSPHVVYASLVLPDMSGHDLARRLRKLDATHQAVLVALTGEPRYTMEASVLAAGFSHCLTKPVPLHQLFLPLGGIVGLVANKAVSVVQRQAYLEVEAKAYAAFRSSVLRDSGIL